MAEHTDSLAATRVADACVAAACLAVDPCGTGVLLRGELGETSERWLELLAGLLPPEQRLRRVPAHVDDERLLGGTDLATTLRTGRAVFAPGLLAQADGHMLVLAMVERLRPHLAASIGNALDLHAVSSRHAGHPILQPTRFGVIALDHGRGEEERCAAVLRDRLALHLELDGLRLESAAAAAPDRELIMAARARLAAVECDDTALRALCSTAAACGIDSLRAPTLALRVARAHAALDARARIESEDLQFAARVVFAARATVNPLENAPSPPDAAADRPVDPPPDPSPERSQESPSDVAPPPNAQSTSEIEPPESNAGGADAAKLDAEVLQAAHAAIPAGLLAQLAATQNAARRPAAAGRAGALAPGSGRGRPAGIRAARPRRGTPLNIVATLRAAAPWQRLRRGITPEEPLAPVAAAPSRARVRVHLSDFRVTCYQQRAQTLTVFALDASGSSALHRLAEAKGAIELLLAECYVRRDQVAVVVFRGKAAEVALAPTRSLLRAKRSLAGLPGGGGTPLAAGIDVARALVEQALKRGQTPAVVFLTDGHANVARDGVAGRQRAEADSLQAARAMRAIAVKTLLIDTAPRPQALARKLAESLHARYLPLPNAEARSLAAAVQNAR